MLCYPTTRNSLFLVWIKYIKYIGSPVEILVNPNHVQKGPGDMKNNQTGNCNFVQADYWVKESPNPEQKCYGLPPLKKAGESRHI